MWTRAGARSTFSIMGWALINALVVISPLILIWGWVKYLQDPHRSDWRSSASLLGLCAPLASFAIWLLMLIAAHAMGGNTSTPAIRILTHIGVWIPIVGLGVGFVGRPRLLFAIIPTCIAAVLFWFGTTLS